MSKRQFKAQASSSRVAAGVGFGGFGSASAISTLSYLTEPPNLSSISDANVAVDFKNLTKKDGTTKSKALEDLRSYVQAHPFENGGGPEEAVLEAWVTFYPRLSIDNSRRVRELSHNLQYELLKASRKKMERYIPKVVGSWLAGTYDRDRAVARAANDGVKSFLDTEDKITMFWKRCQLQILDYAQGAINETPQSLSDERTMSADDVQAKYIRVIGSSISLILQLLVKLGREDVIKFQERYDELLDGNKKLWTLAACDDAFVRRATNHLLIICLDRRHDIIESNLEIISLAFITEALRASQASSALPLLQTLDKLTRSFPQIWTSAYQGKKSPSSRLRLFVEKGSQGGPPEYWQAIGSLLSILPPNVLPADINLSLEFLKSFRDGVNNREESRNNTEEAWLSYFETVRIIVGNVGDADLRTRLLREAAYPVFEQYLYPTPESSKWSIGGKTAILAKAYTACASVEDSGIQSSFANEWSRLADDFTSRILTSLPEQSKDYHKSQTSAAMEGRRWFELLSVSLDVDNINISHIAASKNVISISLEAVAKRNGKPYSAAATVESALRVSPALMTASPDIFDLIKSFLQSHLPKLILSPSSSYLISILNLLRTFPTQQSFSEDVWQSTVDGLLPLPNDDAKLKATIALISHDAAAVQSQKDVELQEYIMEELTKAIGGDDEAWPLFEAITTFNILSKSTEARLVNQCLHNLDANRDSTEITFRVLEKILNEKPELLKRNSDAHITLLRKLLAITELSESPYTTQANHLEALLQQLDEPDSANKGTSPIVHIIRENLEAANPSSLSIETLVQKAKSALQAATSPDEVIALYPNAATWLSEILPLSEQRPSPLLAVMRPFAGAVFAANQPSLEHAPRKAQRDVNGYSVALRMAMYTASLVSDHFHLLPRDMQVELLYLLLLTAELASDQLDLAEDNKLFASHLDPETLADVGKFLSDHKLCLVPIVSNAGSWRSINGSEDASNVPSIVVRGLISKFLAAASSCTPTSFYASKALSHLLPTLVDFHGWQSVGSEEWLTDLGILRSSTTNILGAVAILIGLQENLSTSKLVNNLCNRLVSDITGLSAQADKTLRLVILLNACLAIYDDDDLPVAQSRVVFTVKQILSWTPSLPTTDPHLASEACRALHTLLPAMKDVYGSYWETTLEFCTLIWSSTTGDLSAQCLPMIGMALKLYTILRKLDDPNDDLEDVLTNSNEQVSQCLVALLKLQRQRESQPLELVDDLLLRNFRIVPSKHINNISDFYPLVASDFRTIQSAAFDVLHKAIPEAQQQISVDVLLEKTTAQLPEELLSLLLDAPIHADFSDEILANFPTSIRGYLLSWHLVYDAYSMASYKVRDDYSNILKTENYLGPFLDFMFDVFGHSAARPINLDRAHFDAQAIREYDLWIASDSESNERNMQWLLVNLYYKCLKYTPTLARLWWTECKSKQTRIAVESWTERFFSPLAISDTLDEVKKWAEQQEAPLDDEKELIIKVSKKSREVFAGYEVDDMIMQIKLTLPAIYPLDIVKVESVNRVAVSERQWQGWQRNTQGVIQFSNGNITDGLSAFRQNVVGALKGQTECAICYSIISSDRKMPDKRCQTCKNLFHANCLFKWFASSNQSTCPLCRNPFNYGVNRGGRA